MGPAAVDLGAALGAGIVGPMASSAERRRAGRGVRRRLAGGGRGRCRRGRGRLLGHRDALRTPGADAAVEHAHQRQRGDEQDGQQGRHGPDPEGRSLGRGHEPVAVQVDDDGRRTPRRPPPRHPRSPGAAVTRSAASSAAPHATVSPGRSSTRSGTPSSADSVEATSGTSAPPPASTIPSTSAGRQARLGDGAADRADGFHDRRGRSARRDRHGRAGRTRREPGRSTSTRTASSVDSRSLASTQALRRAVRRARLARRPDRVGQADGAAHVLQHGVVDVPAAPEVRGRGDRRVLECPVGAHPHHRGVHAAGTEVVDGDRAGGTAPLVTPRRGDGARRERALLARVRRSAPRTAPRAGAPPTRGGRPRRSRPAARPAPPPRPAGRRPRSAASARLRYEAPGRRRAAWGRPPGSSPDEAGGSRAPCRRRGPPAGTAPRPASVRPPRRTSPP